MVKTSSIIFSARGLRAFAFIAMSPMLVSLPESDVFAADSNSETTRGARIYQRFCALCHGKHLEGQPNWRVRRPDGKLPAPPHDASGHTWHHSDADLFGMTKFGMVPPYAPADYRTDMPAWVGTLTDRDIWAVLAYIKNQWPREQRAHQREVNAMQKNNSSGGD